MSRLRRIEISGRYFFATTNLARGVPKLIPEERNICLDQLNLSRAKLSFSVFAYAVMPDHVHLLLAPAPTTLPALMNDWKRKSAFAILRRRGARAPLWQARYFDFILRRASDFGKKIEYIHKNPVAAGLVAKPEDWLWSSAAFYEAKVPVRMTPNLFNIPVDPNTPLWPIPGR
ncbi:MAG TPA: transposase [Candidatus Acidoferrales bacterium]|jgi:REP element-mobilizing transposase RayT|nr:transposase [Candidatus Acidoferrales bacterium]